MAQPLRSPVYEPDDEKPVVRPSLNPLQGGGEGDGKPTGSLKSVPPEDLDSAEKSGGLRGIAGGGEGDGKPAGKLRSAGSDEKDQLGKGYTGKDTSGSFLSGKRFSFGKWTRKKTATLATVLVLGGTGIGGFSILQGPFQLVHLSQILQLNNFSAEDDANSRLSRMFRFARSGDAADLRMTRLQKRSFEKSMARLEKRGIKINRTSIGNPTSMEIDTTKEDSPYRGMNKEQATKAIAKDFDIPESRVSQVSGLNGGPKMGISLSGLKSKELRNIRGVAQETLGDGKIMGFFRARALDRALSIGRHPIQKAEKKAGERLRAKELKEKEAERQKKYREPSRGKVVEVKGKLADKLNTRGGKVALGALTGTAILCTAKDVAEIVPDFNANVRKDSVRAAGDIISIGSQVQSGEDIDMESAGAVVQNLTDKNGESVWSAKALQASSGKETPQGKDMGKEMRSAYTGESNWNDINAFLDEYHAGTVCSTGGQAVQAIVGVGLIFLGPGGWALNAVKASGGAIAGMAVMNLVTQAVEPDFETPEVISGVAGGNFIAYGAREAANASARATGGIELGSAESAAIDQQIQEDSRREFQQKSFFARMFDVHDYRSVASIGIDNINTSPKGMFAFLGRSLNPSTIANRLSVSFTPKASAATTSYDWGFNRYGLKGDVRDNDKYADPFDNAEKAIEIIKTDNGVADRAKKCFGVELNAEGDGYSFSQGEEDVVDQYGASYQNANCNETSEAWDRVRLSIFDDYLALSKACYEADDTKPEDAEGTKACQDLAGSQTQPSGSTEAAGVEVNVADIRKDSDNIACAEGTKDLGIQDGYTQGNKVKIRICEIPSNILPSEGEESKNGYGVSGASGGAIVNSRVSGAVLAMAKAMRDADLPIVKACSSFRTNAHQQSLYASIGSPMAAKPGYSNHQLGVALDLYIDNNSCGSSSYGRERPNNSPHKVWSWLKSNGEKYSYKQLSFEFWHWSPLEND